MKLSPHFTLKEMTYSATAKRLGLSNEPGASELRALKALCFNVLEPVREHFATPFSPNSAYRSPAVNSAVHGSPNSQHVKGEAADIEIPGISNLDVAIWVNDNLVFDQLILEFFDDADPSSGWVHVSFSKSSNRKEVLRFDGDSYRHGLGVEPDTSIDNSGSSNFERSRKRWSLNWLLDNLGVLSHWRKRYD